jgi:UTP--glucose-1-phosphate uridylyltransferase
MLPVFDRPIIQYVVEEALESGASDIILVTSKGKTAIEDHFDISPDLESYLKTKGKTDLYNLICKLSRRIEIKTVRQKEQLGLGHAVLMARSQIQNSPFGVMLGDDMIDATPAGLRQLLEVHKLVGGDERTGVVMLSEVPEGDVSKYGICEVESVGSALKITRCVEKPAPAETRSRLAIMGRYLLPRDVFLILENQPKGAIGEIQLTDALNRLATEGRLYGCVLKGLRFDAGDRLGFLRANLHYYLKNDASGEVRKMLRMVSS